MFAKVIPKIARLSTNPTDYCFFLTASLLRGSSRYFVVKDTVLKNIDVTLEFHDGVIFTLLMMK